MQTSFTPQPQDNNPLDSEQNADPQTSFRVNLPYNVNQVINPQSWDSYFHPISHHSSIEYICYKLKPLGLDNRTTLVLSNTRELDRKLLYKLVYLI